MIMKIVTSISSLSVSLHSFPMRYLCSTQISHKKITATLRIVHAGLKKVTGGRLNLSLKKLTRLYEFFPRKALKGQQN